MSNDNSPDARPYVDALIARAITAAASDIHLEPTAAGADIKLRLDGLLKTIETLPQDIARAAVLQLMVRAQLLTYRLDIPQEGRFQFQLENRNSKLETNLDLRLAIMPTVHGLRAVVRLPADLTQPRTLSALGLPPTVLESLKRFARADAGGGGMLLVTGPAGSGKTTTIYALLQHIAATSEGLSIITLEDPIERLLPGITQIEVTPHGQMTYERALKSILRQDPQVLMLGEIRDAATASIAVQAALSGHRLIATLHAGEPATAVARLLEMGIEPYQVTSSLHGILTQRLLRKLGRAEPNPDQNVHNQRYAGRMPVAEFATLDAQAIAAILRRADAAELRNIFEHQPNHATIHSVAKALVAQQLTDQAEVQRVLGDRPD